MYSGPEPRSEPTQASLALVLGALTALGPLSIDMYLPSLPAIQRDLGTTSALTQLTLAAYFAGLGLGQLAYGPLTDRFGRKPPLYAGLLLFVLASLGCAWSPNAHTLIALRFVQALGGAAGQVVTRAVVRDRYVGAPAARLLSLLTLVMGVAPILAPLIGGWVLLVAGWRAILVLLGALGLACLLLMVAALPETSRARTPLDARVIGANLRQILLDRRFVAHVLTGGCAMAGMFAYIAGSPFVLIELFGISPQRYGWIFGSNALGLIAASQLNRRLLTRRSSTSILARATTCILLAGLGLVGVAAGGLGLPALLVCLFAYVTSIGAINPNAIALAMEHQGTRAGTASAMLGALQFAIAALASSLVGLFNDGSALPMASVMLGAAACSWFACRRASIPSLARE